MKRHLARKHMQNLRREAWAGVCLARAELREGQGNPFGNHKVEVASLKTHKDLPPNPNYKTSSLLAHKYFLSK